MNKKQEYIYNKLLYPKDALQLKEHLLELLVHQQNDNISLIEPIKEWLNTYKTSNKQLIPLIGLLTYFDDGYGACWKSILEEIKIEQLWYFDELKDELTPKLNAIPLTVLTKIFWGLTDSDEIESYKYAQEIFEGVKRQHFKDIILYYKTYLPEKSLLDYHYFNMLSLLNDSDFEFI